MMLKACFKKALISLGGIIMNYTNEMNTLLLISLLKKYNIKNIIASPGATNVSFVASIQIDPFFNIYSAVDERSAAFMACGLAEATKEPVVITCTGATASRNYVPGLTEAYYKKLPILAVTATLNTDKIGYYVPQLLDRTQQPVDLAVWSEQVHSVNTKEEYSLIEIKINRALIKLKNGPVHINLETKYSYDFSVKSLPNARKINYIRCEDEFPLILSGKVAVFVGAHDPFKKEEEEAIDKFCESYNAIVICDQTSNYRGKYRILAPLMNSQSKHLSSYAFDLIIHIGYVSGAYIDFTAQEVWRVNKDGELRDLYGNLSKVFAMDEIDFFKYYANETKTEESLLKACQEDRNRLLGKIKDLPFSNIWIAQQLASKLPENSVLHLGILNSLRAWNFFETPSSVTCFSNTGGFGIDGCLSSLIGAAYVNDDKQYYIVLGDLAFFYDCNVLFNKIPNNVHIIVINNGIGTEFKNYNHRVALFKEDANNYIAAKGHNGPKSLTLLKQFAFNNGLSYYSASTKEEFSLVKNDWLTNSSLLEVFTTDKDESDALRIINTLEVDNTAIYRDKLKRLIKKTLGR